MITTQSVLTFASCLLPLVICKVEACPLPKVIFPDLFWSLPPYCPILCHGGGVLLDHEIAMNLSGHYL